jgi:hypothetical protein
VQAIIRKYRGEWLMDIYIRINENSTVVVMTQLEADPNRKIIFPSSADMQTAGAVFKSIVDRYAAANSHNAELVNAAMAVVAKRGPRD